MDTQTPDGHNEQTTDDEDQPLQTEANQNNTATADQELKDTSSTVQQAGDMKADNHETMAQEVTSQHGQSEVDVETAKENPTNADTPKQEAPVSDTAGQDTAGQDTAGQDSQGEHSSDNEVKPSDSTDDTVVEPNVIGQDSLHGQMAPPPSADSRKSESQKGNRVKSSGEEGAHRVTFTVTIAEAVPTAEDDELGEAREAQRRKRIVEAPRAQNYFHCEYSLLPDDEENVKTDVVTFGVAAKIYTERQEPKVLKTWIDGEYTWVAWTHAHTVTVTDDLLKKLFQHKLMLRVWDTRDKLSTRARYDRPKAFKLPQAKPGEDPDSAGGVKGLVIKQSVNYESLQPKRSYINRPLPTQTQAFPDLVQPDCTDKVVASRGSQQKVSRRQPVKDGLPALQPVSPTPTTLVHISAPKQETSDLRSYSRLGRLAGISPPAEPQPGHHRLTTRGSRGASPQKVQTSGGRPAAPREVTAGSDDVPPQLMSPGPAPSIELGSSVTTFPMMGEEDTNLLEQRRAGSTNSQPGSPPVKLGSSGKPRRSRKLEAAAQVQAEHVKKHGLCCVSVNMARLFAGTETITERLDKPVNNVQDLLITVSLSGPLMSPEQRHKLNPLVLKIHSATSMPDTPLSYAECRLRSLPAYVKYQWFDLPEHRSIGHEQDQSVYWDDVNVTLAGMMDVPQLREYLHGPPLEIQIHDRDRIQEKHKLKPTLFGDDLEDEKIGNVGTISSKRTLHNPFSDKDKPWDPYGVAKLDLSGLLLGQTVMYINAPIRQCDIPDVLGVRDGKQDGKLIGVSGAVDGPVDSPLPTGHYLQSGATLKVKVELAYPLVTPSELAGKNQVAITEQCPFGRIVYSFPYENMEFMRRLYSLLTQINADALDLSDMAPHVIHAALSTYKLSEKQQKSHDLDLVTGFHVMDREHHMCVLEGLAGGAMARLWEEIPRPANSGVTVLYHSDLLFHRRLYGSLDVDIAHIKLHENLYVIGQQPLLYVRDMVPKPCFQAVAKLLQLGRTEKLRDAVRNDLFPEADMVSSFSREFGVPLTETDLADLSDSSPEKPDPAGEKPVHKRAAAQSRVRPAVDNLNMKYMDNLLERQTTTISDDFHQKNKLLVREKSILNSLERSKTLPAKVKVTAEPAYNYSTQTLNSTQQAREALRSVLNQSPAQRYTYCPDYHHSMTVVPVNVEAQKKERDAMSQGSWRTPTGWIYPGRKTMIDSNVHRRKLHPARADDLKLPWEDLSRLPRGAVVPRSRYPWGKRLNDMDLWTSPDPVFGRDEPITIHLAGQQLRQEQQHTEEGDHATWRAKLVTDPTLHVHRCATETELTTGGPRSSNQVDRLHSLLKDLPVKYSLRRPGLALRDIPPLSVVQNPSVDPHAPTTPKEAAPAPNKGYTPGPLQEHSWCLDGNHLPTRDYNHQHFISQHGHDFSLYHKERSSLYKRHTAPLTPQDYQAELYRRPDNFKDPGYHGYANLATTFISSG